MQEPNLSNINTGAGLFLVANLILGPILGEYAIIVSLGLMGTLMALSETSQPSVTKSVLFVLRGVTLSFMFTGVSTYLLMKYILPVTLGLTPYAIMALVAFFIGWYSDKTPYLKEMVLDKLTSLIPSRKKDEQK